MKRLMYYHLQQWKNSPLRMSLLLRGARQVGKTYLVREFGKTFPNFVEINLESLQKAHVAFKKNLHPETIIRDLTSLTGKPIIPGTTLLFFDEIQVVPEAITALRYFYEMMPELHVIAAGSLLDFAIEKVGIPVGRVQSLYMYPLSFIEFLAAMEGTPLIDEILSHGIEEEMSEVIHEKLLDLVGEYLAVGGMPRAVYQWQQKKDPLAIGSIHHALLDTYRQDFQKYARTLQVKYVELLFAQAPHQIGKKFKYSLIDGDFRKRELAPALDLLVTAGITHKILYSAGQGISVGAQVDLRDYKIIFLDVALSQALLGLDATDWFLNPMTTLVNKGTLVEAFVGQELLVYKDPHRKNNLYYWHRESRASQAEVDYLVQLGGEVVPVEVKGGEGSTLRSLHSFLETHRASPYGIRFSTQNYSKYQRIHSYPLYAIAQVINNANVETKNALSSLFQ